MNTSKFSIRLVLMYTGLLGLSIDQQRYLSTSSGDNSKKLNPAVVYANADLTKTQILLENKGKAGVYR